MDSFEPRLFGWNVLEASRSTCSWESSRSLMKRLWRSVKLLIFRRIIENHWPFHSNQLTKTSVNNQRRSIEILPKYSNFNQFDHEARWLVGARLKSNLNNSATYVSDKRRLDSVPSREAFHLDKLFVFFISLAGRIENMINEKRFKFKVASKIDGDDDGAYLTDSRWQAQDNRSMVTKSRGGGGGRRIVMSFSGSSSRMPSTSGNFWWFSLLLSALRFHIVVIIIIMGKKIETVEWGEGKKKLLRTGRWVKSWRKVADNSSAHK